jgi:hypothetical protein
MKINELLEATSVGLCFGRFNPPHKGHVAAWTDASSCNNWFVGTNQNTRDKKNPLPYNVKVKCMETMYPNIKGHIAPTNNVFDLATDIYKKHGGVDLKVYTDEAWLTESLERYNGVESKHGYYKFNSITQVPTSRLSSATALRTAVSEGNRNGFSTAAGVAADTLIDLDGKSVRFFDLVRKYLKEYKSK